MGYLLVSRISEPSTVAVVCVADDFRCFVADTSAIILLYRCWSRSMFPCECGMLKFSNVQNTHQNTYTHSFIKPGWPNWLNYPYLEDRIVHMIKMINQFLMTTPGNTAMNWKKNRGRFGWGAGKNHNWTLGNSKQPSCGSCEHSRKLGCYIARLVLRFVKEKSLNFHHTWWKQSCGWANSLYLAPFLILFDDEWSVRLSTGNSQEWPPLTWRSRKKSPQKVRQLTGMPKNFLSGCRCWFKCHSFVRQIVCQANYSALWMLYD